MNGIPSALLAAQRLIFLDRKRIVAIHEIRLELTTEPDQYRVSYRLPRPSEARVIYSLIPRLQLTPAQFEAAEAWLDERYRTGGRPW